MPKMDEKKPHTQEFQLKGSDGNMRCKLLLQGLLEKQQCSKHLRNNAIKKIFSRT